jgi:hypothetical protein
MNGLLVPVAFAAAFVGGLVGAALGIRLAGPRSEAPRPRRQHDPATPAPPAAPDVAPPLVVGELPSPVRSRLPATCGSAAAAFVADAGQVMGITVRAASCRGRQHMESGQPLQDAYAVITDEHERWLAVAVADGVSASPHARRAAEAAVGSVARRLPALMAGTHPPSGGDWGELFRTVAADIVSETGGLEPAAARPSQPALLAGSRPSTTLAVLIVLGEQWADRSILCAAVGDTEILRLRLSGDPGSCTAVLAPEERDARGGDERVAALPGHAARVRWGRSSWLPDEVLMVASDGFAGALGPGNELDGRLHELWRTPPPPLDLLRQVDFRLTTYADDRTVVALWAGEHDERVD